MMIWPATLAHVRDYRILCSEVLNPTLSDCIWLKLHQCSMAIKGYTKSSFFASVDDFEMLANDPRTRICRLLLGNNDKSLNLLIQPRR